MDYRALQDIAGRFLDQTTDEERESDSGSLPGLTSNSVESTTNPEDNQGDSKGYSDWKEESNTPWVAIWTRRNRPKEEDSSSSFEDEDRGRPTSRRGGPKDRGDGLEQALLKQQVNRVNKSRRDLQRMNDRTRPSPAYGSSQDDSRSTYTGPPMRPTQTTYLDEREVRTTGTTEPILSPTTPALARSPLRAKDDLATRKRGKGRPGPPRPHMAENVRPRHLHQPTTRMPKASPGDRTTQFV